jgi:ribosomal protein S18 acetylase RimI-like enzyme
MALVRPVGKVPVCIRSLNPSDASAVCRISADTARFGDPVESVLDDRDLFVDLFTGIYITQFPETCWVADAGGQVVGYLTGCLDSRAYDRLFRRNLLRVLLKVCLGRYRIGRRTLRTGLGFVCETLRRGPSPDLARFPAHLHINVLATYRGQGIGQRLITMYLAYCRESGIPGVHLRTSDQNTAAIYLYRKLGFETLFRFHSPYHSISNRRPIEAIVMGMALD